MHRVLNLIVLPALAASVGPELIAQSLVSPSDRQHLEGVSSTTYPLGRHDARLQTLHSDIPGSTVLQGHTYRRDANGVRGDVGAFAVEMEVTISMSPVTPGQASRTFANNVGANPVVVLPRTTLSFPSTSRPSVVPAPTFDLVVPYLTPYVVDPNGGTLCVDIEMFGNVAPSGPNRNFNPYLDAHEVRGDGSSQVPGFRYGQGCAVPGTTAGSYTDFEVDLDSFGWTLEIDLRNGVPGDGQGRGQGFLVLGGGPDNVPWPRRTECPMLTTGEFWTALPGELDAGGRWRGSVPGAIALPTGFAFHAQAESFDMVQKQIVLGDASVLVLPDLGPTERTTARIAAGSDHTATTGTVNSSVPVMQFF